MEPGNWVLIVPPVARDEGWKAFEEWLRRHDLERQDIADDIRIDLICGPDMPSLSRFWIRREVAERLGANETL
jgi:hypothetical protein